MRNLNALPMSLALVLALPAWGSAPQSNAKGTPTGPTQNMVPIGGGDGGGPSGPPNPPPAVGITLNTILLGSSTTPSTITGVCSDLYGNSTYSIPWGGVVPSSRTGRVALGVNPFPFNGVTYQPLPSTFTLLANGSSTPSPQVVFVPSGSTTSFISNVSITQGNHAINNNLALGRDAALIIQACSTTGFYANFDIAISITGVRTVLHTTKWIDSRINDGKWDGDLNTRNATVVIPGNLVSSDMGITVTLTNPLGTNLGRADLFPTTKTLAVSVGSTALPIPIVHLVPITVGGVLPKIFSLQDQMDRFTKAAQARLPFSSIRFVVEAPMKFEDLVRFTPPYEQNDAKKVWQGIDWYLFYHFRLETAGTVIGVIDASSTAGQFLGTVASGMTIGTSGGTLLPSAAILNFSDADSTAECMAHEFGHQSQRQHNPSVSPWGQVAANPDYSYPYQMANSTSAVGFTAPSIGVQQSPARDVQGSVAEQNGSHDIMGYGGFFYNNYTSDFTWNAILSYWKAKTGTVLLPAMDPTQDTDISNALANPDPLQSYLQIESSLVAVP